MDHIKKNIIKYNDEQDIWGKIDLFRNPIPMIIVNDKNINFCGKLRNNLFGYRFSICSKNINSIIEDFIQYESQHGREPIIFIPENCLLENLLDNETYEEWVVHSTNEEAGQLILDQQCIFSWNKLKEQQIEFTSFGRQDLNEPRDYFDLINLASLNSLSPEIVVGSKQHCKYISQANKYNPGYRFYIKLKSLQNLNGYTKFLGGHALKDIIPLNEVLYTVIKRDNFSEKILWTPARFTEEANKKFETLTESLN